MAAELKCGNCGHDWKYKGSARFYATCPDCLYKVKIPVTLEDARAELVSEGAEP